MIPKPYPRTGSDEPLLEVEAISKTYPGGVEAVRGISFSARRGEALAILGPNGAGKTTTLKIITGLAKHDKGVVTLSGRDLDRCREEYLKGIGMVSQHLNVDNDLTAAENMRVHAKYFSLNAKAAAKKAEQLFLMAELSERKNDLVSSYSGGMKRKLQIARALSHDPDLLVLDEPTTGLDPASRERVWSFIEKLKSEGTTILFSTHYMDEAEMRADRAILIRRGAIIREGSPGELVRNLGAWCVETKKDGVSQRRYFQEKDQAVRALAALSAGAQIASIRASRLEDLYLEAVAEGGKE